MGRGFKGHAVTTTYMYSLQWGHYRQFGDMDLSEKHPGTQEVHLWS